MSATPKKTTLAVMGYYDEKGNRHNSGKDKIWIIVIVIVIAVSAFIAGGDGGGYVIPSNEP